MRNITEIISPGKIQEGAKDIAQTVIQLATIIYIARNHKILEEFVPEEFGQRQASEVTIYSPHVPAQDMPPPPRIDKSTM